MQSDTKRQIEQLSAKGEGQIQVIQWPGREVIFTDGKWKSGYEPAIEPKQPEPAKPAKRLAHIDPDEPGVPYAQSRADQLNELFRRHGVLGEPGRITAETVQDRLEKEAARSARRRKGDQ